MISDEKHLSQSAQIASLNQTKANYEQLISKYQSLPKIIQQKREIVDNLIIANIKLSNQILFRTEESNELIKRLQEFQRMESLVSQLEQEERHLESQYEDYHQLNSKLDKQLKVLQLQGQMLKGKAIIQYNKKEEALQQLQAQKRQEEILQRHLEEMKKSAQILKKKLKGLKQQQKKKVANKRRIQQFELQKQVNTLRQKYQQYCKEFQAQSKAIYATQDQYQQIVQELQKTKSLNINYDQQQKANQKLKEDKKQLQARIKFLESVGIQFIDQKKMLIIQLREKYNLLYAQKQSQACINDQLEKQIAELALKCPEGLTQLKKKFRKKKQPKQKSYKKNKEPAQQHIESETQQKTYRFKGTKLKRILLCMVGILMVFGLIISNTIGNII